MAPPKRLREADVREVGRLPERLWRGDDWEPWQVRQADEVRVSLSHLATVGGVAATTQNQALNTLVFLNREVLNAPVGDLDSKANVPNIDGLCHRGTHGHRHGPQLGCGGIETALRQPGPMK